MVFIVELRQRGALQWLILLKPRPRYANRHMQMREDVYWFDWYFIKYSAAFFSCNGGIFLFDLSTFTDNISRHRVFVKTTFLFPWTFDRFFIIYFFSLSLFSFATFDFGYILTAFSSPIVAAVSFIERTLGVDMKLVQSVSRSALAATMADSNPKCVA